MAFISVDTSGFNSLFSASTKLGQKTVAANVPSQSEKNLKNSNRSLSREVTNLNTENKLLSKENQELTRNNKQLSQELTKTQVQKTQDLYEKNNLEPSESVDKPVVQTSAEKTFVEMTVAALQTPPVSYDASTELSGSNNPGDFFSAVT